MKNIQTKTLQTITLAFGLTLLTACGGGGGTPIPTPTPAPSDTVAPVADTFTPADESTGVEPGTTVSAMFDETMDAATITTGSFTLETTSSTAVTSTVNYDSTNDTVTLTPSNGLALLTNYIAKLKTTITDLAGNALADTSWEFTTRDGTWQGVEAVEVDGGDARDPEIAMNTGGNGVAVWEQDDGTNYNIWTNTYTPGTGWGTAEKIDTEDLGDANDPHVSIDPNGNAIAVWEQDDGTVHNVWTNRYTSGTGWGTAELLETDNAGNADDPHISIDPNGNAIAVWEQDDGTRDNIWARRYIPGTGWGTAEEIEADDTESAYNPWISIDPNGNAIAVWEQYDGIRDNIWANRYTTAAGWGTAQLLESDNAGSVRDPKVAMNASGNAVAVWEQSDGTNYNVWANTYISGTGWVTAEKIDTEDLGNAKDPFISIDPNGNAIAVWEQHDGTRANVWANRYIPGTGWGTAEEIEADDTGSADDPHISIDPNGNAIAVWEQYDGTRDNIWANRYIPGTGWGTEQLIETDNAGSAWDPKIAMDANGNAIAVWEQDGGTVTNIKSNTFK